MAAQRALAAADWGDTGPLRVRMGLHTGPALADGDDYDTGTSHTLNRAARVMSAAHGGQILLGGRGRRAGARRPAARHLS